MIILCNNCNKKFDIDSSFIPKNGRLLQCNNCNYQWFFKKKIINQPDSSLKINKPIDGIEPLKEELKPLIENPKTLELLDEAINERLIKKKILSKNKTKKNKNNKKFTLTKNNKKHKIFSFTIIFIISFVALIIFLETFKRPIGIIIPNIEFLLYSLYETIKDIISFFRDLI